MDTIRNIAVSICVTLLISGLLSLVIPDSNWAGFAGFAIRLFLILCLIQPFTEKTNLNFFTESPMAFHEDETDGRLSELAEKQLLDGFALNLKKEIQSFLEKEGISGAEIFVQTHIVPENRIEISNIKILLPPQMERYKAEVERKISDFTGTLPEVQISQQEGIISYGK